MRSCEDAAHVRATRGFALSWARSWYWLRGECGENNPTINARGASIMGHPIWRRHAEILTRWVRMTTVTRCGDSSLRSE